MKKFYICVLICFSLNVCYAANIVSYDSVALESAALLEIPANIVEGENVDTFIKKIEKSGWEDDTIDMSEVMRDCKELLKDVKVCTKFINTYNKYLNHANLCKSADKYKAGNFTFSECRSYVMDDDKSYATRDPKGTIYDQCKNWLQQGAYCQWYLMEYYSEKQDSATGSSKQYYECISNKLAQGELDFPMAKMEKSCK